MANGSKPTLKQRLCGIGISRPYAVQISMGTRKPSLGLAIRIYRELGEKLGPIKGVPDNEIAALEKHAKRVKRQREAARAA